MLTRVDVQSENPFYLEIRNAKPSDSIIVEKIEGLDPPDINLFVGDYARDGGAYGGRRVPPRSVTITLALNPNYQEGETVSGLRKLLYKAFLDPFVTADSLNFILHDDIDADRFIQGYTDKFEGDPFSDDTTVRISLLCPNPYIKDVDTTEFAASGPTYPFDYEGSAETGIVIAAQFTTSVSFVTFDLNDVKMFIDYDFAADDILLIDTRRGSRKIQVERTVGPDTTVTNILYAKTAESTWLELHSLSNILKVYGDTTSDIVANLTDISFQAQHWGI